MNCYFCQHPLLKVGYSYYPCYRHPVPVIHVSGVLGTDEILAAVTMDIMLGDKLYQVYLDLSSIVGSPHCFIDEITIYIRKHLLKLPFLPLITPENLAKKLPLYLTFL